MNTYKPGEFAKMIGVSVKTLQRWDREGTLKANRTPTNRRYYTDHHYNTWYYLCKDDDNIFEDVDAKTRIARTLKYLHENIDMMKLDDAKLKEIGYPLGYLYDMCLDSLKEIYEYRKSLKEGENF